MHSKMQSEESEIRAGWVSQDRETFFPPITKLIPDHCLKTKKDNIELYILKNYMFSFSTLVGIRISVFKLPSSEQLYMIYSIPF